MKKLLSFLVAGALALGLIGCSGDMHDELDPSSIKYGLLFGTKTILDDAGIIGLNDVWSDDSGEANRGNPLTKVNDTTYTYTFVAEESPTKFCIQESREAKWSKPRWCGFATNDDTQTLKIKPGDSEKAMVYSDDPNPSHVLISGLKVGKGYKLTFKIADAKAKSIQVSLAEDTAAGSGMPDLKVVFVNDSNGEVISTNDMTQTKKGIYEYVFTPTAESTLTYYVTDGNYLFWKADGSLFSTKLDSESEVLSNIAELSTVTTAKRNGKFVPYIINVDATDIPALVITAFEVPDSLYKAEGISYVCSNLGNYEIVWGTKESDGSYIGTVTIPAGSSDVGWGSDTFSFGVTNTISWGVKFTGATLSSTDTYVDMTKGASDNNSIPGVDTSVSTIKDLVITIKSTESTLSVKYTY